MDLKSHRSEVKIQGYRYYLHHFIDFLQIFPSNEGSKCCVLLTDATILKVATAIFISTSAMAILEPCLPIWLMENLHPKVIWISGRNYYQFDSLLIFSEMADRNSIHTRFNRLFHRNQFLRNYCIQSGTNQIINRIVNTRWCIVLSSKCET